MNRRHLIVTGVVVSLLLFVLCGDASARELTFEDRVRAQEAIERVYYTHQIGATQTFERAVPRQALERMVLKYLKQTVALETFWHTPVTAEMLHREWERMARGSRMPDRLREIVAALGNDQTLVEECLARSALVDRLTRSFFDYDGVLHASERAEAERLRTDLVAGRIDPTRAHPRRQVVELRPEEGTSQRFPRVPGTIGAVVEEREAFLVGVVLNLHSDRLRVASYVFPKSGWDDWWSRVGPELDPGTVKAVASGNAANSSSLFAVVPEPTDSSCVSNDRWDNGSLDDMPDGVADAMAVWTGSHMLVWGGRRPNVQAQLLLQSGHRYDPTTDTWSSFSSTNAPEGRGRSTAVWTGREMLVWGGYGNNSRYLQTGGRYDPVADAWSPMSVVGAPQGRTGHTAVWTGREMVIWGGAFPYDQSLNTGGRYDPETDTWRPTTTLAAPSKRSSHTAIWSGTQMVIYGGRNDGGELGSGGRYDPQADAWLPISPFEVSRVYHTAVWTGARMIVWGGFRGYLSLNSGAQYDPVTDTWTPTTTYNAPIARLRHRAVWTGTRMIVWGGYADNPNGYTNTGGAYDPSADLWTPLPTLGAPQARADHVAVWTGKLLIVWGGGSDVNESMNTGGRYDPTIDRWTPTSTSPVAASQYHTAVWTGRHMIIWGGSVSGMRYDPVTDTWSPTSNAGAPAPRDEHTAIWTGSQMVVWGGDDGRGSKMNSGGRYDPIADAWAPTTLANAPPPQSGHTAVWSGSRMIVWGYNSGGLYDPTGDTWSAISTTDAPLESYYPHSAVWTGSRMLVWVPSEAPGVGGSYDPSTNTWTRISGMNAPVVGEGHAAVWTGREMVVWGGAFIYDQSINTGGRYDPETDTWRPTSTVGAPVGHDQQAFVWTGREMIVWGGFDCPRDLCQAYGTGGRYDPVADFWSPMSMVNAPVGRTEHTAVWTGSHMLIWGGLTYYNFDYGALSSGGRYEPGQQVDADGDGFSPCAGDCDDGDAAVHPGATELCDGRDNNCEGQTDEGFDIGQACADQVDACHQVLGSKECRPDGTGTECRGSTVFHDTTPPQASITVTPSILWPPNHRMIPVQVAWSVQDACDPSPRVTLSSVVSDEADNAAGKGDGDTTNDIQDADIGTSDTMVLLRAERSADGPGRVYTLSFTAQDASGNRSSLLEVVAVPHDLKTGPEPVIPSLEGNGTPGMARLFWDAVDGAEAYDVIQGDLGEIHASDEVIWLGAIHVLASGQTAASYDEGPGGSIPAAGHAHFYLVQYWDDGLASGWGTESSLWPAVPTSCNGTCPGELMATSIAGHESLRK